ncbi:MAG: F0F1 ATP synthase subunit gamma [Alphaproteobacteria bacterium]|nr:F0F1 ATP synthase subunit gamma [Alphaproteobacteria bacterium]
MPSLKDLKNRIASVKSTRKITSAMKMVAASKFRRAQDQAESARPYAEHMERMLNSLAKKFAGEEGSPRLMVGTGKEKTVLLIVFTSDRGLCGGFNSNAVREARRMVGQLVSEGKDVKLFCVGRKGRDLLRRDNASRIIGMVPALAKKYLDFSNADEISKTILKLFDADQFDVAYIVYNKFKSVISQVVTSRQLIPVLAGSASAGESDGLYYEYEPQGQEILAKLLPRNLSVQIFGAMLESLAGEHGARMTAMDNATRNAGDMINKLTLNYNRSRQAYITKELIEIISGAEAV